MFNRTMNSFAVLWAIAGSCVAALVWPPPALSVTVAVVKSWDLEDLEVFDELTRNWATYGEIPLSIDTSLRSAHSFTYEELVNTGADVLWLSDPAGGSEQYTDDEIAALAKYTNEGHAILGTFLVFTHTVDNSGLAPIFGLPETTYATADDTAMVFQFKCHDLFRNIPDPYVTSGYDRAQVPGEMGRWHHDDLGSTTLLAQAPDRFGVVTLYDAGTYHAIYVSKMVEYHGSSDDTQFLYNALTYPKSTGTVHNLTQGFDHPSVQCALAAAEEGDEIVVDPGTYVENIDFLGKNLTLRSINPLDADVVAATIIDGAGVDTVVTLSAGEISGFTITNGGDTGALAGGVHATGTSVVSHNVITGNAADQKGGGVTARNTVVVRNNRIANNTAGNRAGGVDARGDSVIINNYIAFNEVSIGGGGVLGRENTTIRNNTIVFNISFDVGDGVVGGGGILAGGSAVLLNNIIAFSTDGVGIHVKEGATVTADYNLVFGNVDGEYSGDAVAGPNDLNVDPLLDADDIHLSESSPAIDAGDPDLVPLPGETDIDGEDRILNDRVDFGCDEFSV